MALPRLHLFELADQPWFPRLLADAGTAYLNVLQEKAGIPAMLAPLVKRALDDAQSERIVDLCAGGGGPSVAIATHLRGEGRGVSVVLTDLHPNEASLAERAQEDGVVVHPEPVDALAVPAELSGLRTVFNAMHHLPPDAARGMLQDAQRAGAPILVVELSERGVLPLTLGTAFIPLFVWLMMPLVRPVRLSWLGLTYLVPLIPWTIAWDGWVSHWRTYSLPDQRELVAPLQAEGWTWEMGQEKVGPGRATWLWGHPTGAAS